MTLPPFSRLEEIERQIGLFGDVGLAELLWLVSSLRAALSAIERLKTELEAERQK